MAHPNATVGYSSPKTSYPASLSVRHHHYPWWRHQIETFSALLALCAGNSPVTGEFRAQRPVTQSFDVFFDRRLNKRLSKQSWRWWFETPSRSLWRRCNGLCIPTAYVSPLMLRPWPWRCQQLYRKIVTWGLNSYKIVLSLWTTRDPSGIQRNTFQAHCSYLDMSFVQVFA